MSPLTILRGDFSEAVTGEIDNPRNGSSPNPTTATGAPDERSVAAGSPLDLEAREGIWQGLTFCLNGASLVVAIDDIEEVMRYPSVSRLPGVPTWLHGLASWRGQPMVLVGLSSYLGGADRALASATRVLVVRQGASLDSRVGAVVDRVSGIKRFACPVAAVPNWRVAPWIKPWVSGWRQLDAEELGVFQLRDLFSRPEFSHALG